MGLLPEFFLLLGIDIFSAMSLLSALLDEDIPSSAQWLFQGAAVMGLGQLFLSQGFITSGVFTRDPTDPTRFWLSVVYLTTALVNVIGVNVYLAAVRRKMTLASTFGGTVTVPTLMASAFFVSSFESTGGNVSIAPATISILVVSAIVSGLSIFGFLRQALKHIGGTEHVGGRPGKLPGLGSTKSSGVSVKLAPTPSGAPGIVLPIRLPSRQEWEEAPKVTGEEERGGEN